MQHVILTALFHQRNYLAPLKLKRPKRMLDIGCGTGKWCFEMGTLIDRQVAARALTIDSERVPKMPGRSVVFCSGTNLTKE